MKIMLIGNTMWSFYNFRLDLIKRLASKGHIVYVLAPQDGTYQELSAITNCIAIDLKLSRKGINPFSDMQLMLWLFKEIRTHKPDVVFNYTIKPIIYGSIASGLCSVKNIAITTGLGYAFINGGVVPKIIYFLYKLSLKLSDQIWFLNNDDRNVFIEKKLTHINKTYVLPGEGLDVDFFYPDKNVKAEREGYVFLMIARLLIDKGVMEFVSAAKNVKKNNVGIRFMLMGSLDDGNPKAISEVQLNSWISDGIVEYIPFTEDVRPYINNADCVVLPSYREGIPRTLLEASSMGKVVIASDVPGCRDVVIDGYSGFLCQPKNSNSLEEVITHVVGLNRDEMNRIGRNGREHVRNNFSNEIVFSRYVERLQGLFDKRF